MKYSAEIDGVEIDRQRAEYICWTVSAETVLAEAQAAGLSGYESENVVVLQKAAPPG